MADSLAAGQRLLVFSRPYLTARYLFLVVLSLFIFFQLSLYTSHSFIPETLITSTSSTKKPVDDIHGSDNSDEVLSPAAATHTSSETAVTGDLSPTASTSNYDHTEIPYTTPHGSNYDDEAILPFRLTSKVGKVSSIWYDSITQTSQAYERALLSHAQHNMLFGYKHYIQRRGAIEKLWSKHAYLIHILVQELNKPVAERLDWLFWHDADVVLLNSLMPLEVFLPPNEEKWAHINLLISNDLGGLNDGTFFVKVCEWSVYFFAAGLSFPFYRPTVHLRYDEQTALGFILEETKYKNNTLHVPQEWFNAYHHWGHDDTVPPEWHFTYEENEPGDLLVHLPGAGDNRVGIINEYVDKVSMTGTERDKWNVEFNQTKYPQVIKEWWESEAERENDRQDAYWRRYHILNDVGSQWNRERDANVTKIKEDLAKNGTSESVIEAAVKAYEAKWKPKKMQALRLEETLRLNGTHPDKVAAD